jgi:hypothetical protein
VLVVLGLGLHQQLGAHRAASGEGVVELLGHLAGGEHERFDLWHRVVVLALDGELGRRRDGVGRRVVATTGQAVGERAVGSEAGGEVGRRQGGQRTEGRDAETVEEVDEGALEPGDVVQGGDRERGQEGGRRLPPRRDDARPRGGAVGRPRGAAAGGDGGGEAPVGDADAGRAGAQRAEGGEHEPLDPRRQRVVAADVARRPAGGEGEQAGFGHLEQRHERGHRVHDRLEPAGVAIGVVEHDPHLRAGGLRLPPARPDEHPRLAGCLGDGQHAVGVHDRDRFVGVASRRSHRPVRAPHRDQPGHGAGRGTALAHRGLLSAARPGWRSGECAVLHA